MANSTEEKKAVFEKPSKSVSPAKPKEKVPLGKKIKSIFSSNTSYTLRKPMRKWWWLFMGPVTIAFIIGFVWPFVLGVYLSFCQFITLNDIKFVGTANYVRLFTKDISFLHAFGLTSVFAIVSLIIINVLAFAIALAMTSSMRGTSIFRSVFFMPNLVGGVVLGYIWSMLFESISLPVKLDENCGFWGLIIMVAWQQIGYMMIIYIAGLNAIPGDLYEAAAIDGANKWQILWHVIIPNVMPSITICTFLSLTNGFKLYDQNMMLTDGHPMAMLEIFGRKDYIGLSKLLALDITSTFGNKAALNGLAQAKGILFFVIVAVISLAQLGFTRKKEVQQ